MRAHELPHVLLRHELTGKLPGLPFRTCRPDQEEATTLGGTLQSASSLFLGMIVPDSFQGKDCDCFVCCGYCE